MSTSGTCATGDGYGPGFLGKMPGVGDFVRHGLPRGVAEIWDDLLIDVVDLSRRRHGREWAARLAAAPAWRFACTPGVSGADAAVGVLFPSTDRVGRPYPLLVTASLPASCGIAVAPFACDPWFAGVESALALARSAAFGLGDLAARLAEVGRPLPDPGFVEPLCRRLIEDSTGPLPAVASLWWTIGGDRTASALIACTGLPPAPGVAALFDDGWRSWSALGRGFP